MDGSGYSSWGGGHHGGTGLSYGGSMENDDDDYEESDEMYSPPSRGYPSGNSYNRNGGRDGYEFDVSDEDLYGDSPEKPTRSSNVPRTSVSGLTGLYGSASTFGTTAGTAVNTGNTLRRSVGDRAAEILNRNRESVAAQRKADDDEDYQPLEATYAELLRDLRPSAVEEQSIPTNYPSNTATKSKVPEKPSRGRELEEDSDFDSDYLSDSADKHPLAGVPYARGMNVGDGTTTGGVGTRKVSDGLSGGASLYGEKSNYEAPLSESEGSIGELVLRDNGMADSFEISAADFEVGTLAARRQELKKAAAQVKSPEVRARRMSFDHSSFMAAKGSSSPTVQARKGSLNAGGGSTFHMSAALSSIHHSQLSGSSHPTGKENESHTGSEDRALFRMLDIPAVNETFASQSGVSAPIREKSDEGGSYQSESEDGYSDEYDEDFETDIPTPAPTQHKSTTDQPTNVTAPVAATEVPAPAEEEDPVLAEIMRRWGGNGAPDLPFLTTMTTSSKPVSPPQADTTSHKSDSIPSPESMDSTNKSSSSSVQYTPPQSDSNISSTGSAVDDNNITLTRDVEESDIVLPAPLSAIAPLGPSGLVTSLVTNESEVSSSVVVPPPPTASIISTEGNAMNGLATVADNFALQLPVWGETEAALASGRSHSTSRSGRVIGDDNFWSENDAVRSPTTSEMSVGASPVIKSTTNSQPPTRSTSRLRRSGRYDTSPDSDEDSIHAPPPTRIPKTPATISRATERAATAAAAAAEAAAEVAKSSLRLLEEERVRNSLVGKPDIKTSGRGKLAASTAARLAAKRGTGSEVTGEASRRRRPATKTTRPAIDSSINRSSTGRMATRSASPTTAVRRSTVRSTSVGTAVGVGRSQPIPPRPAPRPRSESPSTQWNIRRPRGSFDEPPGRRGRSLLGNSHSDEWKSSVHSIHDNYSSAHNNIRESAELAEEMRHERLFSRALTQALSSLQSLAPKVHSAEPSTVAEGSEPNTGAGSMPAGEDLAKLLDELFVLRAEKRDAETRERTFALREAVTDAKERFVTSTQTFVPAPVDVALKGSEIAALSARFAIALREADGILKSGDKKPPPMTELGRMITLALASLTQPFDPPGPWWDIALAVRGAEVFADEAARTLAAATARERQAQAEAEMSRAEVFELRSQLASRETDAALAAEAASEGTISGTVAATAHERVLKALETLLRVIRTPSRIPHRPSMARTGGETGEADGQMSLPKSEVELILSERAEQERLLAGYARENERLATELRAAETRARIQASGFAGEQARMGVELNRLRNLAHETPSLADSSPAVPSPAVMLVPNLATTIDIPQETSIDNTQRKDEIPLPPAVSSSGITSPPPLPQFPTSATPAAYLAYALQTDAHVSHLKNTLTTVQNEARQRELALRNEIVAANRRVDEMVAVHKVWEAERAGMGIDTLRREVETLQERLRRAEGAVEAANVAEENLTTARAQVAVLRQAVLARGLSLQGVQTLISNARDTYSALVHGADPITTLGEVVVGQTAHVTGGEDMSGVSAVSIATNVAAKQRGNTSTGRGGGSSRNAADVRRIRELERQVTALKAAVLRGGNPALPALVMAAAQEAGADITPAGRQFRALQGQVLSQAEELTALEDRQKRVLQSLRAAHEETVHRYESTLVSLRSQLGLDTPAQIPFTGDSHTRTTFNNANTTTSKRDSSPALAARANARAFLSSSIVVGPTGLCASDGPIPPVSSSDHLTTSAPATQHVSTLVKSQTQTLPMEVNNSVTKDPNLVTDPMEIPLRATGTYVHSPPVEESFHPNSISQISSAITTLSLPQAQQRIAELEIEIERVRRFYTGKLEAAQRRADQQLRALKRGEAVVIPPPPPPSSAPPQPTVVSNSSTTSSGVMIPGTEGESAIVQSYRNRLSMLEDELRHTTTELLRIKSLIIRNPSSTEEKNSPADAASNKEQLSREDVEGLLATLQKEIRSELVEQLRLQQHTATSGGDKPPMPIASESQPKTNSTDQTLDKPQKITSFPSSAPAGDLHNIVHNEASWIAERQALHAEIASQRSRADRLAIDLRDLRNSLADQPSTPLYAKCQLLATQVEDLEIRLRRRETAWNHELEQCKMRVRQSEATSRELSAELESVIATARQEHARLTLALRAKDTALVALQADLQTLVAEVHRHCPGGIIPSTHPSTLSKINN